MVLQVVPGTGEVGESEVRSPRSETSGGKELATDTHGRTRTGNRRGEEPEVGGGRWEVGGLKSEVRGRELHKRRRKCDNHKGLKT